MKARQPIVSDDYLTWLAGVHSLFVMGFGIEDIAVKMGCRFDDVRREFHRLREQGFFKEMYGVTE